MAIVEYVLPMDCVDIAAYRFFGALGSIFTLCQSIIWFILCFVGVVCSYVGCGSEANKNSFQYCFYLYYFYQAENKTEIRMNYVTPTQFHNIMMVHAVSCVINMAISILTATAFILWKHPKIIRTMACTWTSTILVFSLLDLITFFIFLADVITINLNEEAECFTNKKVLKNFSSFLSSDTMVRGPAPYLLNLKSDLTKMHKKISHFNRNLLYLNTLLDESSQEHQNKPIRSKKNVNRHVKAVWKEMFNTGIRKEIRRKPYKLPFDKGLRDFIINEQIVLDDSDYDLLAEFDSLINRKWMKPVERSNVTFGKEYNLNETLTADNSANLKKKTKLLNNKITMENKKNTKIARKDIGHDIYYLLFPTDPTTTTTTRKPVLYILELCYNCIYFVLSPPIFCLIMSLKTGLVWLINVIIAVLVGCYGSNKTIKRKFKIF